MGPTTITSIIKDHTFCDFCYGVSDKMVNPPDEVTSTSMTNLKSLCLVVLEPHDSTLVWLTINVDLPDMKTPTMRIVWMMAVFNHQLSEQKFLVDVSQCLVNVFLGDPSLASNVSVISHCSSFLFLPISHDCFARDLFAGCMPSLDSPYVVIGHLMFKDDRVATRL